MAADKSHAVSFFCGGSRNFSSFIDLFDLVFVLEVDLDTLTRRLADRPETEWAEDLLNGNSFCDCMQRNEILGTSAPDDCMQHVEKYLSC